MLSRRQRLVARKVVVCVVVVVAAFFILRPEKKDRYRPGQPLEGLTATLSKELPVGYTPVLWTDVSDETGVRFQHFSGERSIQLPEDMGSGAAWGDFDGDGWVDLYLVNVVGPLDMTAEARAFSPSRNRLFRNLGGRFEDVTDRAGVGRRGWGQAAAWSDYDGDGRLDLVVTEYGGILLYRNTGEGHFEQALDTGLSGYDGFWTGASWSDYDRDGDLDLYVCGYVQYRPAETGDHASTQYQTLSPASINPSSFVAERNLLFANDEGRFEEVASAAGVDNRSGKSLSAVWWDFDNDGWPDLYVANDVSDNALYLNQHDGTFEDVSLRTFVADYRGAMGLAAGDADNDGDLDLFVTHWIAQENAYYQNLFADLNDLGVPGHEALRFADNAEAVGLGQVALDYVGWGTAFLDFDLDGRLDLLIANGHTLAPHDRPRELEAMQAQIFWNAGDTGFFDVSPVSGDVFSRKIVGRGLAVADYDNDGDPDAVVNVHGGRAVLLRNDQATKRRWLKVRLRGWRGLNRYAVGARITLVTGRTRQIRESTAGSSYCSQHAAGEVLFGLGQVAVVDSLIIRWPLGNIQAITNTEANRTLIIEERVE